MKKYLNKDFIGHIVFFPDEFLCPHRWPWHLVPVPQQLLAPSTSWLLQFILGVKVLNPFARVLPSGLDIGVQKCCIFIFLCNPFPAKSNNTWCCRFLTLRLDAILTTPVLTHFLRLVDGCRVLGEKNLDLHFR